MRLDEDRGANILAMGRQMERTIPGARSLAETAISKGWTEDFYKEQLLEKLPQAQPITPSLDPCRDISGRDAGKYSIARAIARLASGKALDGVEREISDEISIKNGYKAEGFFVPDTMLQRNAIAGTGSLGGALVSMPTLGEEFINLQRSPIAVVNMGARILNLASPALIPKKVGAATVNWQNGETSASTLSAVEFGDITLSPKIVTGQVQFSRQLALTSNPQIETILREDLLEGIALAIDKAALEGTGASGQPAGVASHADLNVVTLAPNGSALTTANAWGALVSLESAVATNNGDVGSLGYILNSTTRGKLKTLTKTGLDSTFIWENGTNPLNGYRAAISNQLSVNGTVGTATTICTAAYFGAWDSVIIAQFGGGVSDIILDPYSSASNRVIKLYVSKHLDVGVRRGEQLARLVGIIN